MSKTVVKLRVYKGRELLLKADGKTPANENELITLTYNDLQWKKHLVNLGKMGVCKIEVEAVYQVDKGNETKIDASQELINEIDAVLKPLKSELTPEQKRISELEAKLDALVNGSNANQMKVVEPKEVTGLEDGETLEQLQVKYVEKFKKELPKPFKNNVAWIKTQLEA